MIGVRIWSRGVWLHRLCSALLCSSFTYHVHGVKSSPSGYCKKVSLTVGENFLKQREEFGSILEVHILFRFIIYGWRKKCVSNVLASLAISLRKSWHTAAIPLSPTEGLPSTRLWQQKSQESWRKWRPTQAHPAFHYLTPPFICSYTTFPGAQWSFSLCQRGSPAMWKRNRTKEVCVCLKQSNNDLYRLGLFQVEAVQWIDLLLIAPFRILDLEKGFWWHKVALRYLFRPNVLCFFLKKVWKRNSFMCLFLL